MDNTRIRYNWNEIPFDRNGVHATGREVYTYNRPGNYWYWSSEYEDDPTVDLPETDPEVLPF